MAEVWEVVASSISKLSATETSDLSHVLAEQICHNKAPSPDSYLKKLSLDEWWQVTGALRTFLRAAVKQDFTKDQMLAAMGPVPDDYKKVISDAVCVHREDLKLRLLDDTTAISQCVLTDFDWQLKLVMSSDKLASMNTPVLNIDLALQDGAGSVEQVAVELDQDELKKLLTSLEGCSKAVQQFTA